MCHMSGVSCKVSRVSCHVSSVKFLPISINIYWSLSVKGLIVTGPTPSGFNIWSSGPYLSTCQHYVPTNESIYVLDKYLNFLCVTPL